MATYTCPECGATGEDNFSVSQSPHYHRQRSINTGRRDEKEDRYYCESCEETFKESQVKESE